MKQPTTKLLNDRLKESGVADMIHRDGSVVYPSVEIVMSRDFGWKFIEECRHSIYSLCDNWFAVDSPKGQRFFTFRIEPRAEGSSFAIRINNNSPAPPKANVI